MLAHLSDPHIGGRDGGDPERDLAAAVERLLELHAAYDAVLVTGDLSEHGDIDEYRRVAQFLAPLAAPILPLCGNHDDPGVMRASFPHLSELAPDAAGRVRYAVDVGPLRVVACHTAVPQRAAGELDAEQLDWLDGILSRAPATPSLLAMHHPPVPCGMPVLDAIRLEQRSAAHLETLLASHAQVRRIVCGHAHLTAMAMLGDVPVLFAPSTWRTRVRLRLGAEGHELERSAAGVALHRVVDGDVVSHVQPVDRHEPA